MGMWQSHGVQRSENKTEAIMAGAMFASVTNTITTGLGGSGVPVCPNQIREGRKDLWGVNPTGTAILVVNLHKSQEQRKNLSRS